MGETAIAADWRHRVRLAALVVYALAALLAGWLHGGHASWANVGLLSAAGHHSSHEAGDDPLAAVTAALAHSICDNTGEPAPDHHSTGGVWVCDGCLVAQSLLPAPLASAMPPNAGGQLVGWSLVPVSACGGAHPQGACARAPPGLV